MENKLKFLGILFVLVFWGVGVNAQYELTVDRIMQDPNKMVGSLPSNISWKNDNSAIYFNWNPNNDTLNSTYQYNLKTKTISKVDVDELKKPDGDIKYGSNKKYGYFVDGGALYQYNSKKDRVEKILHLDGRINSLNVLDDQFISFLYEEEIYLFDLDERLLTPVLKFADKKKNKPKANQQDQFLIDQQEDLMEVITERSKVNDAQNRYNKQFNAELPVQIEKPAGSVDDCQIDVSQSLAAFTTYISGKGSKNTTVPHYVTSSGYVEDRNARAKVGTAQGNKKMYIANLKSKEVVEVKLDKLPGINDQPEYFADYPERIVEKEEDLEDRKVNVSGFMWSEDGAFLVANILSDDNKDRWIVSVDPKTGDINVLDRQHDEAWIGGPGIGGWSFWSGSWGWMSGGKNIWFQSEATGFSHLYTANVATGIKKQLTKGDYEVSNPFISANEKYFYFTANKDDHGQKHFYRMLVNGGALEKITAMEGNNEVVLSPDEKYLAIRNSFANSPWELYLQENKPGKKAIQVTNSLSDEFKSYVWRTPKFIKFKADDGTMVPARLYQPENPETNGPAVIFVHGAGYLQNAHKWWSSYFREYMFHNLLVDRGYTVLDIDYRGSAGYGRDWRTAIYRHMGGKDLSDQVDGAKYLVDNHKVSADRIGIYGGSYGGFITLMAMFNHPDVFKAGAALRSVTDWAHYNHGYTENILNSPVLDSIAYRRSSPIYFADGLEGALLMCHGLVDDNVQFQDIVRLSQRLIELGKENWELAVYPVEPHGFKEPSSWADEYKRILKLFEENLK